MNDNLINLLNEINILRAYDIYLPSLKRTIKFKPLIIEQFRDFVDKVSHNPFFNIGFQQELTNIIRYNILTNDISYKEISEIDKLAIALTIRINDVSSLYNETDISFIKDSILTLVHPESKVIIINDITLQCQVPNLNTEENYNTYAEQNLNEEVDDANALKDIINLMFVAEIAKCIYKITINNVDYIQTSNFKEWIKTVSSLPITILNEALQYTDNVKSVKDNMLKIGDSTSIDYDLRLFTSS